jgi:hypothetical protein
MTNAKLDADAVEHDKSILAITVDSAELESLHAEYESLVRSSPPWLQWLAAHALNSLDECIELRPLDDGLVAATGASQFRVTAQVSNAHRLLVAALRAGNGQSSVGIEFPL